MGSEGNHRKTGPDANAPVAVELEGVGKRYDGTVAVQDVDLRIREGEFFTLVGPSGCGKTTTLRLIAGFEEPTEGRIRFGDRDVSGVPPEARNVGVVFQNYALFPHMTVGENVGYGLRFSEPPGGASREERVRELLELVDLPGTADRDPESLSGGQRQRVAMARALAPGPDLLLLDEPMSALDARLRERLRLQVRSIQRELGITTVYVTHDQEEALSVSDRVAVMRGGTPEQVAPPRTVYRRPASRFVAEFVGDNNVFEGVVAEGNGGVEAGVGADSTARTVPVDVGGETLRVAVGGEADAEDDVPRPGDSLTFCVRPQHLRVGRTENGVRAEAESAEFLGETTRVHLGWGGRELVVRTEDPLSGTVAVGFDPADAHVIGADPGE
ncbi:thiamine transport system ATP-binding protein [Halorubrum aquaticum]|uniref:Molybdate/tungstate import ATP-binding protein WtpC n=1 Tax=Halorubrum aquaticum TaxID=387340 RepID=A0A1I3ATS7_9EURY|nr:ABC transporter ATP-binding protein [Halorubrum aquaticum]SFH53528.1 thiamine transport system ATP-binding protein [Halorubrum aquaticum]